MIDLLEEAHWSYDEYLEAPAELVDEWLIRIEARRTVEVREAKRREQEAAAAARRKR